MKMLYSDNTAAPEVGKLLSEPTGEVASFTRTAVKYEDNSARFKLSDRSFSRQYAHIYVERLLATRPLLEEAAKQKWGDVPITKLFQLQPGKKCVVIGTMFKHMDLKPSILKEISQDHNLIVPPSSGKYIDESDELILEDELQRIALRGEIDVQSAVTGVIVAVCGVEPDEDRGRFHVEDVCFQQLPEQVPPPVMEQDRYVVLLSGLDIGSKGEDLLGLQLLVDLVTGQLGDECQQEASANIVRIIIAGNSLSKETQDKEQLHKAKYLTKKTMAGSVEAIKSLDDILVQLAACMDVDVLPGEFDPANFSLPQQALHRCMFPQAMRYPTMSCVTNPYDCSIEGIRFLGSSGQPVNNIYAFSSMEDELEILSKTLEWGHLCPTAPDTLSCYPFYKEDPFILQECPHIYFAGNQTKFQNKLVEGPSGQKVQVVTIPRFSQTSTAILVNLRTLDIQPISFSSSFPSTSQESPDVEK